MGNSDAAVQSLKEAIRLAPLFSDTLYNLAAVDTRLGEKESVAQCLKQAIQLNPSLASEARRDEDFGRL
jgi:tetratricopeptide (TPR) repeat protein